MLERCNYRICLSKHGKDGVGMLWEAAKNVSKTCNRSSSTDSLRGNNLILRKKRKMEK